MNTPYDEVHEQLEAIAESLELKGLLDAGIEQHNKMLACDTEWNTPKYIHVATLLRAFVQGILTADPWYHNYKLPPNFEGIVNWIAFNIQRKWPEEEVPKLSLLEAEQLFTLWAYEHPDFKKWNEAKPGGPMVRVVTRYSSTPDERDFISTDVVIRNAAVFLRDHIRQDEAFDRKFEKEYGKLKAEDY